MERSVVQTDCNTMLLHETHQPVLLGDSLAL